MTSYGPRVPVHPDRIGSHRTNEVRYLVLHTSEQSGAEDPNDAEDLAKFLTSPGDRTTSSGGRYGSSYHGITDTDRVLPCVADDFVAYAASGGNRDGLHLCLPVKAGQTRAQWLDATSRPYIRIAAWWIVDKARAHRLPLVRISPAELAAGRLGYCDHGTVSKAFGLSTHTDVGPNFPWDVLAADIATFATPPPPPTDWTPGGTMLYTSTPKRRLVDTRTRGAKLADGETFEVTIPNPPDVIAKTAILNVTVADPDGPGYVQVDGASFGETSDGNFQPGGPPEACPTIAAIDAGRIRLRIVRTSAHVIVDLLGVVD